METVAENAYVHLQSDTIVCRSGEATPSVVMRTEGANAHLLNISSYPLMGKTVPVSNHKYRMLPDDEAISLLQQRMDFFNQDIEKGGFIGAVAARKQHFIDQYLSRVKERKMRWSWPLVEQDAFEPSSQIFVVQGVYTGHGPADLYAGVQTDFSISERGLADLVKRNFSKDLPSIPESSAELLGTSYGTLVGYLAFEIPEEHARMVKIDRTLSLSSK